MVINITANVSTIFLKEVEMEEEDYNKYLELCEKLQSYELDREIKKIMDKYTDVYPNDLNYDDSDIADIEFEKDI